jgi:hypothetical protein
MRRMQHDKGARIEREIVELHRGLGLLGEQVPLSDASRYQGNGADADIYPFGPDKRPLCGEVKVRVKALPPLSVGWATTTSSPFVETTLSQLSSGLGGSGRDSSSEVD